MNGDMGDRENDAKSPVEFRGNITLMITDYSNAYVESFQDLSGYRGHCWLTVYYFFFENCQWI